MIKTAECVSPKHPDKMCDQISDALLDLCLQTDPASRVAVEVMGGHGEVYITGEITSTLGFRAVDAQEIVKRITGDDNINVVVNVVSQSPEIANGVNVGGAGDQGIMVGYACNENEEMIPQELYLARSLCKFIYEKYPYDGKTQITLDESMAIKTIVASFQNVNHEDLKTEIKQWLIQKSFLHVSNLIIHANPAGDWNVGGFDADTGLTGRKIIVDAYGPQIAVGGGAFSGKDASKVDRSGAYMARKIAVDLLKEHKAHSVLVKLAYAIGVAQPVMAVALVDIGSCVNEIDVRGYDLTPAGIRKFLELDKPQYEETAKWGHFGNGFKWDI
jgi:S-adenosylmethionine synthetase